MTEARTTDTTHHGENDNVTPSEARIILGPLVKYALMGLVLAAVLLTTVVMLDHRITDINREVAALEAEFAAANEYGVSVDQTTASQDQTNDSEATATHVVAVPTSLAATTQSAVSESQTRSNTDVIVSPDKSDNAAVDAPIAPETTVASKSEDKRIAPTTIATTVDSTVDANATTKKPETRQRAVQPHPVMMVDQTERWAPFDQTFEAIIAERNDYMKHRDHVYLEDYRASQEKQLQLMRDRLARERQKINDWEAYYQQRYDTRANDLKELQEIRENFTPDRI